MSAPPAGPAMSERRTCTFRCRSCGAPCAVVIVDELVRGSAVTMEAPKDGVVCWPCYQVVVRGRSK